MNSKNDIWLASLYILAFKIFLTSHSLTSNIYMLSSQNIKGIFFL